jgi:hypothetical protein
LCEKIAKRLEEEIPKAKQQWNKSVFIGATKNKDTPSKGMIEAPAPLSLFEAHHNDENNTSAIPLAQHGSIWRHVFGPVSSHAQ